VNGRPLPGGRYADNPYRLGGMLVSKRTCGETLERDEYLVEIFI